MCEWGNNITLELTIIKELSYTGKERKKMVPVDACLAPIIKALNDHNIVTIYSCCGHGKKDGIIILKDDRYLIIKPCHGEIDRNSYPKIYDDIKDTE